MASFGDRLARVDLVHRLHTSSNNGTAGTNCTVVHWGDGIRNTAVITVTNAVITVGNGASLGVGYLVYTLPSGACLIDGSYMSIGIGSVTTTGDTPEVALGITIASGVITQTSANAAFENILTGQVAADTNGTATVKGAGPTAAAPLEVATGDAHTIHLNMADGWTSNADASGLLNGTIVIHYIRHAG